MKCILLPAVTLAIAAFSFQPSLKAQSLVNIETVQVGDAGNAADTTGYGAVSDEFNMGKYEVTIGQYATFLNSVASVTADSYIIDLWNPSMAANLNVAGISRSGSGTLPDPYSYTPIGPFGSTPVGANSVGNRPISYVSWFDAARFANWMNNGASNGASTETGAYTLNGSTSGIILKNPAASWWIPSENEWYKAAYYKGGSTNAGYWLYPTQSDTAPGNTIGGATNQANYHAPFTTFSVTQEESYNSLQNYLTDVGVFSNSTSAYDTFDQGGNLYEWNDAVTGSSRIIRGGSWADYGGGDFDFGLQSSFSYSLDPTDDGNGGVGFRLATVPEPSTYALLLMAGVGALWMARRRTCRNQDQQ